MIELYTLSLITLILTLIAASALDIYIRRVKFKYWYPLIIIGTLSTIIYVINNLQLFDRMTIVILITTVVVFWLLGHFKFYGGADAWALIFITIFSITIPFNSMLNNSYTGIGVSTYINSYIIYILLYPVHKYIFDRSKGVPYVLFITLGFLLAITIGDIYQYVVGVIL